MARRRAVAHLKPGTTATHTPSGQVATVAWEANGPRGLKGPWYRVWFTSPVVGAEHHAADGRYYMTVHGSTLNYGGMVRANPFDGSKRQAFAAIPRPGGIEQYKGYTLAPMGDGRVTVSHGARHLGIYASPEWARYAIDDGQLTPTGKVRKNPPLAVFGNPGHSRGGKVLSRRAISIRYVHATDGERYEHKFGRDDVIELLPDGSFRIFNAKGKRLWKDF